MKGGTMQTYIEEIDGLKYKFCVEELLYSQMQPLLSTIKEIPKGELHNGYKIEVGFSLFILLETSEGYDIVVPDYVGNPFTNITEDLTIAMWIQLEQTDMLRQYKLSGKSIRFDDKIAVAKNALENPHISLQRFSDLGGSGWCIKAIEKDAAGNYKNTDPDEYEAYYAYQLLQVRSALLKALLLPYEYIVIFNEEEIVEILNEKNESILT